MKDTTFLHLCWRYVHSMDRTTAMAKDRWEFINQSARPEVSAFSIRKGGRFGNAVIQLVNAIYFAKASGVSRIYIGGLDIQDEVVLKDCIFDGIKLITTPPNTDERILSGHFFYLHGLEACGPSAQKRAALLKAAAQQILFKNLRLKPRNRKQIVIHIRSGDLFALAEPHPRYAQPPLSYYQLVIEDAIKRYRVGDVHVVFEDRSNPCVSALEKWLLSTGLPFQFTSEGFMEDARTLLSASIVCMGVGSFVPAFLMMSKRVSAVYRFRNTFVPHLLELSGVDVHLINDRGYIDNWRNTPEQLSEMLNFPQSRLLFSTLQERERHWLLRALPTPQWLKSRHGTHAG